MVAASSAASSEADLTFPVSVPIPPAVVAILQRLEAAGHETWCVGGAIRDELLGNIQTDVDLATAATPDQVQRLFPRTIPVGIDHGTVGVLDENGVLHEVTTFRRDVTTDGRHAVVAFGVSLDEDLARRDFTMNAIAWHPIRGEWRDPFNGKADIEAGVVRAVGVAGERFREDRLRILRALRFAARFSFSIEPVTWAAAQEQSAMTDQLSAERVRDEWWKGVRSAVRPGTLMRLWHDAGVARVWFCDRVPPALEFDIGEPGRDPLLLLAAWCSPIAPVLKRLKCSGLEIARGIALDRNPSMPAAADEISVRRWLALTGTAAADHAILAGWLGRDTGWLPAYQAIIDRGDPTSRGSLAITGDDLTAIGCEPGPQMGAMLGQLLEAVLEDPSRNTREQLLELARQRH
jgi:tRNA nucleotidyltransferase (CCA-adding enzyme)